MSNAIDEIATLTADLRAWIEWQHCLGTSALPRSRFRSWIPFLYCEKWSTKTVSDCCGAPSATEALAATGDREHYNERTGLKTENGTDSTEEVEGIDGCADHSSCPVRECAHHDRSCSSSPLKQKRCWTEC